MPQERAIEATDSFLEFPGLVFLTVDVQTIHEAWRLAEEHALAPRDAIHAAACTLNAIPQPISEDKDFDTIEGLRRCGT